VLEYLDAQVEIGTGGGTLSLGVPDDPPGVWDAVSTRPRAGGWEETRQGSRNQYERTPWVQDMPCLP